LYAGNPVPAKTGDLSGRARNQEEYCSVRNVLRLIACLIVLLPLLVWDARGMQQSRPAARVVAIGDIHADVGALRLALQAAGAVNARGTWIGGNLTVVQLGDLIGRSDDERAVLDMVFDVQRQAAKAGGALHALIGNHEVFAGRVDNQAVGPNPFPAWEGIRGLRLDHRALLHLPRHERARGAALMPGGPYALRIAEFPVAVTIGGTVFAHGGVTPRWAAYGIARINREVSQWLKGLAPEPESAAGIDDGDAVMWTRQFSLDVDEEDCAVLERSLRILNARRMVVAHTVHEQITPRCGERVWAIDVGMSRAYGGRVQVLEIVNDRVRVIAP
jgi:hypothetical protein